MGLFSNNKKLCPICGSPTPRFLATKFENEAICKDCDNKIDLPDGVQGKMTLADFRQYIAVMMKMPLCGAAFQRHSKSATVFSADIFRWTRPTACSA